MFKVFKKKLNKMLPDNIHSAGVCGFQVVPKGVNKKRSVIRHPFYHTKHIMNTKLIKYTQNLSYNQVVCSK